MLNTLRPRRNVQHFADDIFKRIFFNENVWISIRISLKFVPKGPINNIPALVLIMAWRRPGDKPLSEAMMVSLLTHICVTRPQWVEVRNSFFNISTSRYHRIRIFMSKYVFWLTNMIKQLKLFTQYQRAQNPGLPPIWAKKSFVLPNQLICCSQ